MVNYTTQPRPTPLRNMYPCNRGCKRPTTTTTTTSCRTQQPSNRRRNHINDNTRVPPHASQLP